MKKIIKLTENDLIKLVKRVIKEENRDEDLEHFDRVNEYANVLRSGEELPPIIYTNGLFRDGAHRMAAHTDVGRRKILAFYGEK
jgi:hypothetical protein